MQSENSSLLFITAFAVVACISLVIVHRRPSGGLHADNNVVGYYFTTVGTIFAVILAFLLIDAYGSYHRAREHTELEAVELNGILRMGERLPEPSRDEIRKAVRDYTVYIIDTELKAMRYAGLSLKSPPAFLQLWDRIVNARTENDGDRYYLQLTIEHMLNMQKYRRLRMNDHSDNLPTLLWIILSVGASVTVLSSCVFGVENKSLHALKVGALSLMILLVFMAIWEVAHPYSGLVHVSDEPYRAFLQHLDEDHMPRRPTAESREWRARRLLNMARRSGSHAISPGASAPRAKPMPSRM